MGGFLVSWRGMTQELKQKKVEQRCRRMHNMRKTMYFFDIKSCKHIHIRSHESNSKLVNVQNMGSLMGSLEQCCVYIVNLYIF